MTETATETPAPSSAGPRLSSGPRLPPGPPLPRILQTAGFIFAGPRFLEACRRRYGSAVTFTTIFDDGFVMVFDPALTKEVFQGSPRRLHAGEANALLGPILGERSVLVLDEDEHLRHRRLMLPPFHGRRMEAYADRIITATDREIDGWPVGEPFALLDSMQTLTLRVILAVVFGESTSAGDDDGEERRRRRLRAMIAPLSRPRGLMMLTAFSRLGPGRLRLNRYERNRRAVDEFLYADIERRRRDPELARRDDVFSALLVAEDDHGERLSDREVRDELMTLLVAGHETTATGLAWTFDLLLHTPTVHRRAAERDPAYLDAVVKESLRIRPVIPAVGRIVRGGPFRLGDYVIPEGVEINPSIRIIHSRPDLYADPGVFRPERFLGPGAPDTYTWLPFGGGTRRCLGASFALMEMRLVLARVLERAALRPAHRDRDDVAFRGITLAPRRGAPAIQDRPPGRAPSHPL